MMNLWCPVLCLLHTKLSVFLTLALPSLHVEVPLAARVCWCRAPGPTEGPPSSPVSWEDWLRAGCCGLAELPAAGSCLHFIPSPPRLLCSTGDPAGTSYTWMSWCECHPEASASMFILCPSCFTSHLTEKHSLKVSPY